MGFDQHSFTVAVIDAIILTPKGGELTVYLKGDPAGILNLAQNKEKPLAKVGNGPDRLTQQVSCVAGERYRRYLLALFEGVA